MSSAIGEGAYMRLTPEINVFLRGCILLRPRAHRSGSPKIVLKMDSLELSPQGGDPEDLGIEDGSRIWRARSFDPAFIAKSPTGGGFAPGWYRASAAMHCRSGEIDSPRLYLPDRAGQFSEAQSVDMRRDGTTFTAT